MKKVSLIIGVLLLITFKTLANIPTNGVYQCGNGETFSFSSLGEVYPEPYMVLVNGVKDFGSLSTDDDNLVELSNEKFIRVDQMSEKSFVITYTMDSQMLPRTAFNCSLVD